jgi:hypothetical protein
LRKRRRDAAILAASLLAHIGMLAAWMATRLPDSFVEAPAFQVELLRPTPRPRPPPPAPRRPRVSLDHTLAPPPSVPTPLQPPALASPAPVAPIAVDPRKLTDQELVEQSGPRADLNKVFADRAKRPLYSSRLPPGGDDCKPATEHSNRIAPPCPNWGAGPSPRSPAGQLPNRADVAGEAAYKNAMKGYREAPGAAGYPGIACAILHKCGP